MVPDSQQLTANSIRTFIALDLPGGALEQLDRIQRRLMARLATDAIRWTPREGMHVTLKFLGDVGETRIPELSAAFREACRDARALRLALDKLGCFPGFNKPSVIWMGLCGELERLQSLQQSIESATAPFAAKQERRPFQPHLTLGRIRPGARGKRGQGGKARRIGALLSAETVTVTVECQWTSDCVTLYKSELTPKGPVHTPLERLKLPET